MLLVVGFFCWLGQLVVRVVGISLLFLLWLAFGPNSYTLCVLFFAIFLVFASSLIHLFLPIKKEKRKKGHLAGDKEQFFLYEVLLRLLRA